MLTWQPERVAISIIQITQKQISERKMLSRSYHVRVASSFECVWWKLFLNIMMKSLHILKFQIFKHYWYSWASLHEFMINRGSWWHRNSSLYIEMPMSSLSNWFAFAKKSEFYFSLVDKFFDTYGIHTYTWLFSNFQAYRN